MKGGLTQATDKGKIPWNKAKENRPKPSYSHMANEAESSVTLKNGGRKM